MRSPRPAPRGFRASIAAVVGVLALLAVTVAPVAARPPGPPAIPALSGVVTNACTGLPITNGLSVGVAAIDPAAPVGSPPGPPTKPPNPNFGFFAYRTLAPVSYQLTIDAPGYISLGADPASPVTGSPGVTIMMPPGPPILPAGQALAIGLLLDVRLVPTQLPISCRPPGPPVFPALAGRVTDSTTGRGVQGLSVGVAAIDPAAPAGSPPGPPTKPPNPNFGFFAYRTLAPVSYQLTIDAPGYISLGADPASPVTGSPGVTIMMPPGPPNLPAGQIVNESLVVAVQMPPGPPA